MSCCKGKDDENQIRMRRVVRTMTAPSLSNFRRMVCT